MNIQVRVLSARAQTEVAALRAQVAALQRQLASGGAAASAFGNATFGQERRLTRWGNQIQWAGRQVQFNFTLPLLLAGGAAMKWQLDNERAMTSVAKVYGDGTQSAQVLKNELNALGKAFEALSERFGVNQAETIEIAAGWAAAGASGVALARATEITMKTMVLGQLDAVKATESLIAIQAQYGLTTQQLSDVIAQLNIVENQTGVSLAGLIEGFARAAGVARSAGVDTRHLAAAIAAMSPAAGSAAQAGNALKTIISRLLAPTKEAVEVMKLMGINVADMSWKSLNATQRLELMAKKFQTLDTAQRAVVSAVIASRYQINKFDVLMREIASSTGFYQKALDATSDRTRYLRVAQQELNQVLNSSPQKLKIIWTILQNAAADIIQPMIPLVLALANAVKEVVQWFSNLNPGVQKFILGLALVLALVGPVVRYIGALATLAGFLGISFTAVGRAAIVSSKFLVSLISIPLSGLLSGLSALAGYAGAVAVGFVRAAGAAVLFARGISIGAVLTRVYLSLATVASFIPVLVTRFIIGFRAIAITVPVVMAEVSAGLVSGMAFVARGFAASMVAFAALAGQMWRVAAFGWSAILSVALSGIITTWRRLFAVLEGILLGGSAVLGGIWRAMLATMAALTVSFGSTVTAVWRAIVVSARTVGPLILSAFKNPWVIAIAFVIGILYKFRDKLVDVWNNVVRITRDAFNSLPQAIVGALKATITVIATAAKQIYDWFSYINPFAHHSPSLVEEVVRGMKIVRDEFGKLKVISPPLEAAKKKLVELKAELRDQQGVVNQWKKALDAATARVDAAKKVLDGLTEAARKVGDQLDAAKQDLENIANTPIQGMKAMEDAIFANDQAQKALQLQLMKMEDVVGPLDKIQNKMSAINGQIEMLRGTQTDLRNAGAGSDILSFYNDQISALQGQQASISQNAQAMQDLQDQIDALNHKAQELDLEKSLKFDALLKQIDDVAHGMKELPFDEIIKGVTENRAKVDELSAAYDKANAAVAAQQAIVDKLQTSRDAIEASYDREKQKLADLQLAYNKYSDQVTQAAKAVSDFSSKALGKKAPELTPGAQAFLDAAGGNFPEVGGTGGVLSRELPGVQDQSKLIEEYTKGIAKETGDMFGKFDMFKPLRDGWQKALNWTKTTIGPWVRDISSGFKSAFSGAGGFFGSVTDKAQPALKTIQDLGQTIWKWLGRIWSLLGPEVKKTINSIVKFLKQLWVSAGPQLQKLAELWGPFIEALGHLWHVAKPILGILLTAILFFVKTVWSTVNGVLGPAFKAIAKIIGNVLQIIVNVIKLVLSLINGDWKDAWDAAQQIVAGVFALIGNIIKGAIGVVIGFVKGLVEGIVNFFKWLYNVLVGHSIIPDLIYAIVDWFKSLPKRALDAIIALGGMMINWAKNIFNGAWNAMKDRWNAIYGWASGVPAAMIRAIAALINLMGTWAKNSFTNAWNGMKQIWNSIYAWATGIPSAAARAISGLGTAISNVARSAFQSFWNMARSVLEGTKGFLAWLGGIPAAAGQKLAGLGSVVANAVKSAWNGAADWINRNVIGNVNKVTGVFGVNIPSLPRFAKGGVIPGPTSKKDNVLIAARTGEGILVPEAVKAIGGPAGLQALNKMATGRLGKPAYADAAGGVQHFAVGGVVGKVSDWLQKGAGFALDNILKPAEGAMRSIIPRGFFQDYMAGIVAKWRKGAQQWGSEKDAQWMGPSDAPTNPTGNQSIVKTMAAILYGWINNQWTSLHRLLMGESGFNNTAQNPSSSAYGMFQFLDGTWATVGGHKTSDPRLQSQYGLKYIKQSYGDPSNAYFKWLSRNPHWYDQGGMLQPGMSFNGTRKPEPVLTHAQWDAVMGAERAFASLTRDMLKSGALSTVATANARARMASSRASDTLTGGRSSGDLTVHIHGDLSFPNIDNSSSAETFLANLETMVRG